MWRHKTVFWIYVTIFVRSSVFLLLLWVHDAFDFRLRVIKWYGIQSASVWCAHYVVMKSLGTSQSHFLKYITWFSYALLSSNFFYDRMLNVISCYDTANEWALNTLSFDVRLMWLWRHVWRHNTVFWTYVTIFVTSSVFFLLLWVHDAFDVRLRVIKWIGIQLAFIQCAPHVVMKSLVTSQSHFPKSITWFSYCCFLTSFVIACWILPPVITHQMNGHQISFRFTYALFGYDVTCDVTKSFSKSITRFSQDLLSSYTCMSALCI